MSKAVSGYAYYTSTAWKRLLGAIPSDFTVWKDTSTTPATYRAECNFEGGTDYPGTEASAIIQAAIDGITQGSVYIKNMNSPYEVNTAILAKSGVDLISDGAELKRTTANVKIINCHNASDVTVDGIYFNGDNPAATTSQAIWAYDPDYVNNLTVQNCKFDGWADNHAVSINGNAGAWCKNIKLLNNLVGECNGFGVGGRTDGILISGNYFFEPTRDYGIMVAGNTLKNKNVVVTDNIMPFGSINFGGCIDVVADNAVVKGNICIGAVTNVCFIHDNFGTGGTDESTNVMVTDNYFSSTAGGTYALLIRSNDTATANNVTVANNVLNGWSSFTSLTNLIFEGNHQQTYGVYLTHGANQHYMNNFFTGTYAFQVEDNLPYPTVLLIRDNRFAITTGVITGPWPTASHWNDNEGFANENQGSETGNGAQQDIHHGCDFTPSYEEVFLSERSTGGALAYQSAAPDAAHIYVTAVNAKTYNWRVRRL